MIYVGEGGRERAAAPPSLKGLKRGFDGRQRGRLRKAKPTRRETERSGGFGAESRMERTNWMLCGASLALLLVRVHNRSQMRVQAGSDAVAAAAIGKGDCSCRGIPFIQEGEGDRRGDGERGGEREREEI